MPLERKRLGPYILGPHGEELGVYEGDAFTLAQSIPDDSIHAIICDPIYQYIHHYEILETVGTRILVPGGHLIMQAAHQYLPELYRSLGKTLDYVWQIVEEYTGGPAPMWNIKVQVKYKPYLWYSKGPRMGEWVFDMIRGKRRKDQHPWGDAPAMFLELIHRLVPEGGIILDPFVGSGPVPQAAKALGRYWLAFDDDPDACTLARANLQQVAPYQPHIPSLDPSPNAEQLEIWKGENDARSDNLGPPWH